jgi:hypothetical protein
MVSNPRGLALQVRHGNLNSPVSGVHGAFDAFACVGERLGANHPAGTFQAVRA